MYSNFEAHFKRSKQPQQAGFECKKHLEYVYMCQPTTPKVYVLVALQEYLPLSLYIQVRQSAFAVDYHSVLLKAYTL